VKVSYKAERKRESIVSDTVQKFTWIY